MFAVKNQLRKHGQLLYEWFVEAHVHAAVFVTTILYNGYDRVLFTNNLVLETVWMSLWSYSKEY